MQKNILLLTMLCAVGMSGFVKAMHDPLTGGSIKASDVEVICTYEDDGKNPKTIQTLQKHLEIQNRRINSTETKVSALESKRIERKPTERKSTKSKPIQKLDWKEWVYAKGNGALPWITASATYSCLMQKLHVPVINTIKPLALRSAALLLGNMPLVGKAAEKAAIWGASSIISRATPMVAGVVAGATFAFNVAKDTYYTPVLTTRIAWNKWFRMQDEMPESTTEEEASNWAKKLTSAEKAGLKLLAAYDASKKHGADLVSKGLWVAAGAAVLMAHGCIYSIHNK